MTGADAVICLVTAPPDRARRIHPYDTFELIALDVADGAAPYLSWIGESVDAG